MIYQNNSFKKNIASLLFTILTGILTTLNSCSPAPQKAPENIEYDLQGGYASFKNDSTNHFDSMATEQAIYLAKTYGDDGITQLAPGIKNWLKSQKLDYDSIKKAETQAAAERTKLIESTPGNTDDAYGKISVVFGVDVDKVKPMLDELMTIHHIVLTNEHVLQCGNVLVAMKNDSKIGVTEMNILKHMYQNGSADVNFVTQAAISATILEKNM